MLSTKIQFFSRVNSRFVMRYQKLQNFTVFLEKRKKLSEHL